MAANRRVRPHRLHWPEKPVAFFGGGLLLLLAVGVLGVFGWLVARRIAYPYDLEWMEGGMLCHALRLYEGQPIYAPPSVDFIPHLYTPLYPAVVALLARVTGDVGYLLGRAVSVASFAGALLIGALWAYREGRSAVTAVAAMALPVASFAATGGFYDLARADSLQIFLTVAGLALSWYGRASHLRLALAAVLLVASFFAKQTAAPLIAFAGAGLLLTRRKPVVTFAVVGIVGFAATVYLLNRASEGWFWTYIFRLHQGHSFYARRAFVETPLILGRYLGPALLLLPWGLSRALRTAGSAGSAGSWSDAGGFYYLGWLALGGVTAACVGFGTQWAHTNAFIPGIFFPAIAIGAAAGRLVHRPSVGAGPSSAATPSSGGAPSSGSPRTPSSGRRPQRGPSATAEAFRSFLVLSLLAASLALDARTLRPASHLPTAADRAAGDALIARMRATSGEILIPFHPFYGHLSGKRTYLHRMGVWDVRGTVAGRVRGLEEALSGRRFALIVFDNKVEQTWGDWPGVLSAYQLTERIVGPRTVEGADTRPGLLLTPLPPVTGDPTSSPANDSANDSANAAGRDYELQ